MSRRDKQRRHPQRAPLNALARWQKLNAERNGFIRRVENYAAVTIPKVCLPEGVKQESESIQHDWQSVGAQAVNHLLNKLMLAMFRPSAPFFRLDPTKQLADTLAAQGVTEEQLREALVGGEQQAIRVLDQKAIRPKLYETLRHLIITGNVILDLTDEDAPRVIGIKRYVAKRSVSGRLIEVMIHERVLFDELDDDAKAQIAKQDETEVDFIRWYKWSSGKWRVTQHVDAFELEGPEFSHEWDEDDFPIRVLTWDLADEHNYGTGLVEDYAGDFGTLSTLSEAEVKAALLASDYRWLANPAGITDINDFKNSSTGDVLAGKKEDLSLVSLVGQGTLEQVGKSADKYIRRIGMAFLLGSAVTRDAERVTAEEVRMQANELETSLGGVYSRLSVDLQLPLVRWLLKAAGLTDIKGTKLTPTIVTGLAALSRTADATQLTLWLQDVAGVATLPEPVLMRLNWEAVLSALASARGITPAKYVRKEQEVQADIKAAQDAEAARAAQGEVVKAGAQAAAKQEQ